MMRQKGFTLLEIIIAITLFSLVAVIIGMSLRLSIASWERADREAAVIQKMRSTQELFTRYLRAIYPYYVVKEGSRKLLFRGTSDKLRFASADSTGTAGAFQWCDFRITDRVVLLACSPLPDKEAIDRTIEKAEELLTFRSSASFEYYSRRANSWSSSWEDEAQLPSAIRIKVDDESPFVITLPMGNPRATVK